MKRIFITLMLLLCFSTPALASSHSAFVDSSSWNILTWKPVDKTIYLMGMSELAVDWAQTSWFISPAQRDRWVELNPILGPHPNERQLTAACISSAIGVYVLAAVLPDQWRTMFLNGYTTIEMGVIARNFGIGIRTKW